MLIVGGERRRTSLNLAQLLLRTDSALFQGDARGPDQAGVVSELGRDDGEVIVRAFPEGDQVVVEIEDNGAGIPPEIQDRVFDSFFTTKPPGSGTGLGLDISFGIVVNKHRGDLRLASSRPGCTVFRVELPRNAAPDG